MSTPAQGPHHAGFCPREFDWISGIPQGLVALYMVQSTASAKTLTPCPGRISDTAEKTSQKCLLLSVSPGGGGGGGVQWTLKRCSGEYGPIFVGALGRQTSCQIFPARRPQISLLAINCALRYAWVWEQTPTSSDSCSRIYFGGHRMQMPRRCICISPGAVISRMLWLTTPRDLALAWLDSFLHLRYLCTPYRHTRVISFFSSA